MIYQIQTAECRALLFWSILCTSRHPWTGRSFGHLAARWVDDSVAKNRWKVYRIAQLDETGRGCGIGTRKERVSYDQNRAVNDDNVVIFASSWFLLLISPSSEVLLVQRLPVWSRYPSALISIYLVFGQQGVSKSCRLLPVNHSVHAARNSLLYCVCSCYWCSALSAFFLIRASKRVTKTVL